MRVKLGASELVELGRKCKAGEIVREGYRRSGYTRKDGSRVGPARVGPSCVPDKGAPGKTPASQRWFPKDSEHLGWKKDMSEAKRHNLLRRKTEQKGCLKVGRALVSRANLTTDRETEQKMRADAAWLERQGFCKLKKKEKK